MSSYITLLKSRRIGKILLVKEEKKVLAVFTLVVLQSNLLARTCDTHILYCIRLACNDHFYIVVVAAG